MKKYKLLIAIAVVIAFCFIYSCKKDQTASPIDFKYGYFPIDTGHYVIYEADSIIFNASHKPDTSKFYIKEVIQSIFTDNTGAPTCWVQGYRSSLPNGPWNNYYTWTANRTMINAQRTENNLRYTKLTFPPTAATTWAGNSYIDCIDTNAYLAGWIYSYQNIDVPLTLTTAEGSISFDSSLTVLQDLDSNAISDTYSVEQYAKNVGLVYKELDVLAFDSTSGNYIPWPQKANSGYIYRLTAISYNK